VLGGIGVGDGHALVDVAHEHGGRLLTTERRADAIDVLGQ
jgi:hypothetical protein